MTKKQVGSGVGLVGVCLAHVKASAVSRSLTQAIMCMFMVSASSQCAFLTNSLSSLVVMHVLQFVEGTSMLFVELKKKCIHMLSTIFLIGFM